MAKKKKQTKQDQSRDAGGEAEAEAGAGGEARSGMPIVGIGASAGGLEAFRALLEALPADTGMGFVLVQHLDPQHASSLVELLARVTRLPVQEVTDGLRVRGDHVYVIPPNTMMTLAGGALRLEQRDADHVPHRPIDTFFDSLASDQQGRAIGVVLSGTASDGTLGLEAIKAAGGFTFAQDDSAKYDSMPRSAVAAGCVDLVLSPADIAGELARMAQHPYVVEPSPGPAPDADVPDDDEEGRGGGGDDPGRSALAASGAAATAPRHKKRSGGPSDGPSDGGAPGGDGYRQVLTPLRNHSGVDFSLYKPSTIQRRIHRRMVLSRQHTPADYARLLRGNPKELDALYADVLINVTSFFRNPEAFEALKNKVLPDLLKRRGNRPVRVWVLGCSTGQEAYSLAMAFSEVTRDAAEAARMQVFATDLNEALLERARNGLYPKSAADELSPQRLRRFFVEEDGGYRVTKSLRDMVVFARQNVISDPPFSRMDLVSCRNLLIYLGAGLQKKVLPTLHYALNPRGILFLGASESVGEFTELYEPVDKKHKIFSRKAAPTPAFHLPMPRDPAERYPAGIGGGGGDGKPGGPGGPGGGEADGGEAASSRGVGGELSAQREADRVVLKQFAPPGVLVNDELGVLQFRGATDAYLQTPSGKASFDVLKMARDGLRSPLRAAIDQAGKSGKPVRRDGVRVRRNGESRTISLRVIPLKNLRERCLLILFEPPPGSIPAPAGGAPANAAPAEASPPPAPAAAPPPADEEDARHRVAELEDELAEARDYLQSTQEQYEAANEELQAANEEVHSANEELQSINEELETSKEELESSNEELTTVNEEMANRNEQLNRLNNDLVNFQNSARLALVLLSRDLAIRRFTPQAEKQFELVTGDVGQPIGRLRHPLVSAADGGEEAALDLEALASRAIADVREQSVEVRDGAGRWGALRVRPYITHDNKIDGAVMVLSDIDRLKRDEIALAAARDYADSIIATVREPLLVLDGDLRVTTANRSFYRVFEAAPQQTRGRPLYELGNGQWDIPELRRLLEEVLPRDSSFEGFEVEHEFEGIGRKAMLLNARRLRQPGDHSELILLAIEDVTQQRGATRRLEASEVRYRRLFETARDAVLILDADTREITDANPFVADLLGYARDELVGKELWEIGLFRDIRENKQAIEQLLDTGYIRYADLPLKTRGGKAIEVEVIANVYEVDGRRVIQCNIRDVTERKRAERSLRESEERYRVLFESMDEGYCIIEMLFDASRKPIDYRFVEVNDAFEKQAGMHDAAGKRMLEFVSDIEEHWLRNYANVALTGEPVRFAAEYKGLNRWFEVYAFRVGRPGDNRVAVLFTDITARKRAEQSLRESEERFRHMVQSLKEHAVVMLDDGGRVTSWNEGARRLFGYAAEEVIGTSFARFFPAEEADRPRLELEKAAAQGHAEDNSWRVRKDGSRFWASGVVSLLRDDEEQADGPRGFVKVVRDMTAQKEIEDAIRESDRNKDLFLGTLAHELRNPLAPISNALELMGMNRPGAEAMEQMRAMMARQVKHITRLIDDLMDASRIGRGKLTLRIEPTDLGGVIRTAQEAAASLTDQAGQELTVDPPAEPLMLDADPARLTQVFTNLLGNASKYSPRGARIVLTARREGDRAVVRVRDNGIGIPAGELSAIFEMFTQLDAAATLGRSGLGVGLALARSLVQLHGGDIEVRSDGSGRGSEFIVRLPLAARRPAADRDTPDHGDAQASPGGGYDILLVDDARIVADLFAQMLAEMGHRVRIAASGAAAIEQVHAHTPDIVFSDISMPGMSGYELAQRLRASESSRGLTLVAVSGYGQPEDRDRALGAGFDHYLVKPPTVADLDSLFASIAAAADDRG